MFVNEVYWCTVTAEEEVLKADYSNELAKEMAPNAMMVKWQQRVESEIQSYLPKPNDNEQ